MSDLQALPAFLMRGLASDPTLALAVTAAWLDPGHFFPEEYTEDYIAYADRYRDDDPACALMFALGVARRCFPEVYAGTVQRIRAGDSHRQVTTFYCAALSERYPHIELWGIEDMIYGVPCQWAGLEPCGPEFVDEHPQLVALLADFGVAPREHTSSLSGEALYVCIAEADYELAYRRATPLIHSLIAQDAQPYGDLAFLLMWLFSASGNSLVDHSYDSYADAGFEPLEWEPDTLQLVDEAHQQAEIILQAAQRGLEHLQADDALRAALRRNVQRVSKALERNKNDVKRIRLDWPGRAGPGRAEDGAPGETGPDAALLQLRACYAPDD